MKMMTQHTKLQQTYKDKDLEKLDKEMIQEELSKLKAIREEFYSYLDANIPSKNIGYDFSNNPTLEACEVYERFFKLDYQSRKLGGFLYRTYLKED